MTSAVREDEIISRFFFSKKSIRSDNTVRHNELMPPPHGRLSVYRTSDLADESIWQIGKDHVEAARGDSMKGRGDVVASAILNAGLNIDPNGEPHPLHANVINWTGDSELDRLTAMKISASTAGIKIPD